jgi:hypothetical protein
MIKKAIYAIMNEVENTGFGIKLSGDLDGVDTNTLVDMIGNMSLAIHQINDDIQSNKSLKVTIKYIQPGCYDIFLTIKETFLDTLIMHVSNNPISAAADIIVIFSGLLTIRQFLKGEPPKEVDEDKHQTIIINGDGNKLIVKPKIYKIYNENQIINNAIGKSFDTLNEDMSIDGFELYDDKNNKLCNIPRDDFKAMAIPTLALGNETRIKPEEAILTIFKVVFEKGYKWQFYYQGNKISATIQDETFYDDIDKGAKFAKGDTLIVDLNITQIYDNTIQTYINKEYLIEKIKRHIPRTEQSHLLK